MSEDPTLAEAVSSYLQSVKDPAERNAAAQELSRFTRWYGGDRQVRLISPGDLERYQEQLGATGGDPSKLGPLRQFFAGPRTRKLLAQPLAAHIRVRRKTGSRLVREGSAIEAIELTQSGFDQLQAELVRLEMVEQPSARAELQRAAADKDFRENAPYDAAKQHLAELQRRVNDIKAILGNSVIVASEAATDRTGLHTTFTVRDLEEDEELTFTLVGPGEVDPRNGKISVQSPVGRALNDRRVGETVEVDTPAGLSRYRIERIDR
jgi:transcription elongation factor GreA